MKKLFYIKIAFFITLFFGVQSSYAQFSSEQEQEIKRLSTVLSNQSSHDTSVADAYLDLSGMLYVSNMDTMIPLCEKSIEIIEKAIAKHSNKKIINKLQNIKSGALNNIGFAHMNKGNIDSAISYLLKSIDIIEVLGDKKGIALGLNNIGYIYNEQGHVEKALEFYHKSLKIEEEIGNKKGVATSVNNIAYLYKKQGEIEKALDYFNKSLNLFIELKNSLRTAGSYNNIGSVYELKNDLDKALNYYYKALNIRIELENKIGVASSYNSIGHIYEKQNNLDKALNYYSKSLFIREEIKDKDGLTASLNSLAKTLLIKGDLKLSKKYAERGLLLSEELGFPENIQKSAKVLSEIYEKEKSGMKALEMHKLYIIMRDSIFNRETQKSALKEAATYEYEKQKVIDDAQFEKLIAVEKESKEKQKVISYSITVGALMLLVFVIVILKRLQITNKQKKIIEDQKIIVDETNEELNQTNEELLSQRDEIESQKNEMFKQKSLLEFRNNQITSSITYAKRIQEAILPPADILNKNLGNGFVLYEPKDVVAGDFYWLETVGDIVYFAVADCTGHGVPGAMVSVVCNNALNRCIREYKLIKPSDILNKARELVISTFENSEEQVRDGMDISLCLLNKKTNKFEYSGAYNPLYIIRNNSKEIEIVKANKQPVGYFENQIPFDNHRIEIFEGDCIYLFTDGIADQFGGIRDKKFGYKRFKELLLSVNHKQMTEQKLILSMTLKDWMNDSNAEQLDDICVMGIKL